MADPTEKTVAEELREAAKILRETAGKATRGPWARAADLVLDAREEAESGPNDIAHRHGERLEWVALVGSGTTETADARWICLTDPLLAEPLASWLGSTAKNFDEDVYKDDIGCNAGTSLGVAHCDVDCPGHKLRAMCDRCGNPIDAPDLIRCHCWDDALAVARVLNGGEAGSRG